MLLPRSRGWPPAEGARGTNPSQAANGRPCFNGVASLMAARMAVALTGHIPGMVCSRGHSGRARPIAASFSAEYAKRFSRLSNASYRGQQPSVLSAVRLAGSFRLLDGITGRNLVRPWGKTTPYACRSPRISLTTVDLAEPLPRPMQGLAALRLWRCAGHAAPGGAGDGFAYRFGSASLVLRQLHAGLGS